MIHEISSAHLSIECVEAILKENKKLALSEDATTRIVRCREYLDN